MTYAEARKQYRRIGTNNATGDALRAMYADLLVTAHGGNAQKYFDGIDGCTDEEIANAARILLRSREASWDILIK